MPTLGAWSNHRLGWLVVLAGGLLALGVQLAAPVRVPLYDGVVVQEPYRYLHPTGDQLGSPTSFSSTFALDAGASPIFVAPTGESPPQAQLVAQRDAIALLPGTTSIKVSVTPIESPGAPPDGAIAGNVYRISVTSQDGTPLAVKACNGCISLTMRAPDGVDSSSLQRFASGAWTTVKSEHTIGLYYANVTFLGDFAIIAGAQAEGGPDVVLIGGIALLLLVAGGAFLLFRVKPAPRSPPSQPTRGPGRVPSKRRSPRTPPPGRPNR